MKSLTYSTCLIVLILLISSPTFAQFAGEEYVPAPGTYQRSAPPSSFRQPQQQVRPYNQWSQQSSQRWQQQQQPQQPYTPDQYRYRATPSPYGQAVQPPRYSYEYRQSAPDRRVAKPQTTRKGPVITERMKQLTGRVGKLEKGQKEHSARIDKLEKEVFPNQQGKPAEEPKPNAKNTFSGELRGNKAVTADLKF